MAVITADTFDPLRRYVGVRLQQGVPIVDADWNELDDAQRFERRAFLRWFIGDGVPAGLDSFRIQATGAVDDFTVLAGAPSAPLGGPLSPAQRWQNGLYRSGHYLVDGMDVLIPQDIAFSAQPLHRSQPGAAALAASLGVSPINMPAPADGRLLAYLDVWERLVRTTEDPSLVHPGLGVESCVRLRREWCVRVRSADAPPQSGDPDFLEGHSYAPLAYIIRRAVSGAVNASDVTDLRPTGLTLRDNLRIPIFARKGVGVVDAPRFALMLDTLRTILFTRWRTGQVPHATADSADELTLLLGLQQVMALAQSGELQTRSRTLDNAGALAFLNALYGQQDAFLDLLQSIGSEGAPPEVATFLAEYRARLDGDPAQGIGGLHTPLEAGDLFDATLAQEAINQWLALATDALPEGAINVFYITATPFEPLAPHTNASPHTYVFRYRVESQLSSPLGSEDIVLQPQLTAASWTVVGVTPPALNLANGGGDAEVEVAVRPNAAHPTCTLTLIASSARAPLIASVQPGINLALGSEPPAGSLFLFYNDAPLNADGELEIPVAQLAPPGRNIGVRLINSSAADARRFRLTAAFDAGAGNDADWVTTPSVATPSDVQLAANTSSTRNIRLRNAAAAAGQSGTLTVTATLTAVNGVPVPDGASSEVQVRVRVIA